MGLHPPQLTPTMTRGTAGLRTMFCGFCRSLLRPCSLKCRVGFFKFQHVVISVIVYYNLQSVWPFYNKTGWLVQRPPVVVESCLGRSQTWVFCSSPISHGRYHFTDHGGEGAGEILKPGKLADRPTALQAVLRTWIRPIGDPEIVQSEPTMRAGNTREVGRNWARNLCRERNTHQRRVKLSGTHRHNAVLRHKTLLYEGKAMGGSGNGSTSKTKPSL